MLKQDVPLRTGWFGYRKLDVENCIAHIRAAYAAELRLARQTQQGMEETMAQLRQENKALRQRFAQQAAAQAAASSVLTTWVWPTTCAAPLSGSWCCARCRTCSCCMPSRSA